MTVIGSFGSSGTSRLFYHREMEPNMVRACNSIQPWRSGLGDFRQSHKSSFFQDGGVSGKCLTSPHDANQWFYLLYATADTSMPRPGSKVENGIAPNKEALNKSVFSLVAASRNICRRDSPLELVLSTIPTFMLCIEIN